MENDSKNVGNDLKKSIENLEARKRDIEKKLRELEGTNIDGACICYWREEKEKVEDQLLERRFQLTVLDNLARLLWWGGQKRNFQDQHDTPL